jgi:hypothetical protein
MSKDAPGAARELYVYFHAAADHAAEVEAAVRGMQQRLRSTFPPLRVALLRRPDDGSGRHTWMETYAWASDRVEDATEALFMQALGTDAAIWQHLLEGPRHLEVFERCA